MAQPEFEHIEAYLAGTLSPVAQQAFEQKCQADPEWSAAVQSHLQVHDALQQAGRAELKARLQDRFNPVTESAPVRLLSTKRTAWRWIPMAVAAAIALIALIAVGIRYSSPPPTGRELYAQHFEVPPVSTFRQGAPLSQVTPWQQALQAYKDQDFASVISLVEPLLADSTFFKDQGIRATLYLSIAYMQTQQADKAIAKLQEIKDSGMFQDQYQWYLALAYLQQENLSAAQAQLQEIANTDGHFRQIPAREILKQLPHENL